MTESPGSHVPFPGSGFPVRQGNRVLPWIDGEPAFLRICEAVEAARQAVWLAAAFFDADLTMPGRRGTILDVLDAAAGRGLDVRVVFWRPNTPLDPDDRAFPGSPADRLLLRTRGSLFLARWDRAEGAHCQHQKSWLIDAGHESERAWICGMNLTAKALVAPGHAGIAREGGHHDVAVELAGPAATDVHHNFVQRWNEASEREAPDGTWGDGAAGQMDLPARVSERQGASVVQIQRTMPARLPGTPVGELSILDQYILAIDAARTTIYIENQALPIPQIAARLIEACRRGVLVVMLVPADRVEHAHDPRRTFADGDVVEGIRALARQDTFTLAGIAADGPRGRLPIHVHSKIMLIDDAWATVGSCNLHAGSMFGHAELNASFRDPVVVRRLRCDLFAEHLGQDTTSLDDRAALALYRKVATENHERRDGDWQGLAFRLDTSRCDPP